MAVHDDGRGLVPPPASGRGLVGMRERVAAHRGTVEAAPNDGGWRVRAVLYYDEEIGRFRAPNGRVVEGLPEWMVIQRAPLPYYNHVPEDVVVLASRCYA